MVTSRQADSDSNTLRRNIFVFLIVVLGLLFLAPADTQAQIFNIDTNVTVRLYGDADSAKAIHGTVVWDTTRFEYRGYQINSVFTNPVENISPGHLEFAWASPYSVQVTGAIVLLHLTTKNVVGEYVIPATFQFDENPGYHFLYSGNIVDITSDEDVPELEAMSVSVYPNPANPEFNLIVTTPYPQMVYVGMYDATGTLVKNLYRGWLNDSVHLHYTTDDLASGMYLFALQTSDSKLIKSITILK